MSRESLQRPRPKAAPHFFSTNRGAVTLLLAPAVIVLALLTLYPTIDAVRLSLIKYNLMSFTPQGQWNSFQNYTNLFNDPDFWSALQTTLIYSVEAVILELLLGFALAVLLNQKIPGRAIARTFVIAPMVMAPVVVGTAWRLMYNPIGGILNYVLGLVGIPQQDFLGQEGSVIPSLVATDVWEWSPLVMLIILAGLQGLSPEVYEAARVDGASAFRTFRSITLPLLKPAIAVALLFRSIDCLRTFDTIFAMTGGGPGTASQTLTLFAYNEGLEFGHIAYASATGVVLFVIIDVIAVVLLRLLGTNLWRSRT